MRALFSIRPFHGHFEPAALLAAGFVSIGGEVIFATAPEIHAVVEARGFEVVSAGLHPRHARPGSGADYGYEVVDSKASAVLSWIESWHPDIVVRDPTDIGAVIAAEAAGLRSITLGFCEFIPARSWDILAPDSVGRIRAQFGLAPDPRWTRLHSGGYVDLVPDWFHEETVVAEPILTMRPVELPGPGAPPPPSWLDGTLTRPTIGICLGTVYNRDSDLLRMVASAARGLGFNVVLVTGPGLPIPAWARGTAGLWAVNYIPLRRLLQRLDILVTAGGFNTVMAGLAHGIPMLGIPGGADQPRNTRRLAELECGIQITRRELTEHLAASALRRLLTDGRYRINATRLQELIAELPTPVRTATAICQSPLTVSHPG